MKPARALLVGLAAMTLGAAILLLRANAAEMAPTGTAQVHDTIRMLRTPAGTYRVHIWEPGVSEGKIPLVLYAPGWGGRAEDSAKLVCDLASHGYLVVAFDDPVQDARRAGETRQEREDIAADFRMDTLPAYREGFAMASRRVAITSRKGRAVLDGVLALPDLEERIDPARIGIVGFSFGGATGVELAHDDPRIKAVVNLDGWVFGKSAKQLPSVPYLLFYIDEDFPDEAVQTSDKPADRTLMHGIAFDKALHRRQMKRDDFFWLRIHGFGHEDLKDEQLRWNWRHPRYWLSLLNPEFMKTKQDQFAVITAFLDRYLKGEAGAFPPAGGEYPGPISTMQGADLS
ncbi:alpha/beta hydrolase family protein [Novosphingobium malaysiense]|uniref:Dienelactone hydrolase domain-containing protein n=1 Tax=Novosphingobium malaysiense TaxID=1348853 RepID=A0A0B1ZQJ8_9SPHN|nr:alpha/beta fold hydrolase [Novosphingobium malaysiense]KHK92871.1 hypothetical protein LK12_00145 [Novosphingobium malaysiense]